MTDSPQQQHHQPSSTAAQDASRQQPASAAAAAAQLASAKMTLRNTLRNFPDFPIPGIDFVDIMPLFANPHAHSTLVSALEWQIDQSFAHVKPDVIVGLDARGFLFGPGLALRLGVGFATVRKKGKLPGPCVTAEYVKEYGKDLFQMQQDAVGPGQKVLIVDDIIATGMSLPRRLQWLVSGSRPPLQQVARPRLRPISSPSSRAKSLATSLSSKSPVSTAAGSWAELPRPFSSTTPDAGPWLGLSYPPSSPVFSLHQPFPRLLQRYLHHDDDTHALHNDYALSLAPSPNLITAAR